MTPAEIEADLTAANAHAKRFPAFDGLSRLHAGHTQAHTRLNALLDVWECVTALNTGREAPDLNA